MKRLPTKASEKGCPVTAADFYEAGREELSLTLTKCRVFIGEDIKTASSFSANSGLGKSETALGLVKHGHALVADDLTCVRREIGNNLIYGSASDSTAIDEIAPF